MYRFARALAVAVGSGLLLVVFLFVLGIATTDYLIGPNLGNGLEALEGEEWYSGQAALRNAQFECGGSRDDGTLANWLLRHKFRVVELQILDGLCPLEGRNAVRAYQAKVQSYTLFMIPTGTVFVQCGSVDCNGPSSGGL